MKNNTEYTNLNLATLAILVLVSLNSLAETGNSKASKNANLVSELNFTDPHFQSCIEKTAKKNAWKTAAEVTDIKCHNQGIASINGIEQLVNIKKLSLHKNKIETLNLPTLSELRHINIARNKLKELKLDNLPNLEKAYFFGNQLTSANLNNLPSLSLLKLNNNKLTKFSYDQLPSLEKIYLFDNQLEFVDIYHLPAMTFMECRQNPMSDELYEEMDALKNVTILHDGNAEDWE